jgi:hypothetical protein
MFQGRPIIINKIEVFLKTRPDLIDSHNENTLKLSIEPEAKSPGSALEPLKPLNGLLRAVKAPNSDVAGELGNWILTARFEPQNESPRNIDPNAIKDILVICNYSL